MTLAFLRSAYLIVEVVGSFLGKWMCVYFSWLGKLIWLLIREVHQSTLFKSHI